MSACGSSSIVIGADVRVRRRDVFKYIVFNELQSICKAWQYFYRWAVKKESSCKEGIKETYFITIICIIYICIIFIYNKRFIWGESLSVSKVSSTNKSAIEFRIQQVSFGEIRKSQIRIGKIRSLKIGTTKISRLEIAIWDMEIAKVSCVIDIFALILAKNSHFQRLIKFYKCFNCISKASCTSCALRCCNLRPCNIDAIDPFFLARALAFCKLVEQTNHASDRESRAADFDHDPTHSGGQPCIEAVRPLIPSGRLMRFSKIEEDHCAHLAAVARQSNDLSVTPSRLSA